MDIVAPTKEKQKPIEIFCCYAREDQRHLRELEKQLMPLKQEGIISLWSDVNINAGADWEKEVHLHLNTSHIILLLVSPDFIYSDYCYSREMKRAMERHESSEAQVIPIILRPVLWQNAPFRKLQMLPTNARPVTSEKWGDEAKAFLDIAEGIRKVVVTLLTKEEQADLAEEAERARRRGEVDTSQPPPASQTIQSSTEEEEGSQAERERARQEQEQAEKLEAEKLPRLIVKPVKRNSSRRTVLVGLAWLVIVVLIRGVVGFTAHQTPLTRGIQASLAGRITSGANATTTVQATSGTPGKTTTVQATSGTPGKTTTVQATSGTPGKTWQTQNAQNANISQHLDGVAWSGSQFVVVGYTDFPQFKVIILTSPDGHTWTAQNSSTLNLFVADMAWLGKQFVVVGEDGAILTSPDGRTWTAQNSGTPDPLADVAWSGTRFVVVGYNGAILTSPDEHTWTAQNSGTTLPLKGITWSGKQFVVVGAKGVILTSPDGRTWTAQNSGTSNSLDGVAWSGTQFVVVSEDGAILTSPDGRNWTAQNSSTLNLFLFDADVAWLGKQFVVVGDFGAILTSPDGRTWTTQNSGTLNSLDEVAWSGTRFVVVGDNGTILTSP